MAKNPLCIISGMATYLEIRTEFKDKELELTDTGLPASIRIDAFPDKILQGHVKQIDEVASQSDWLSSDVKVYRTLVSIDESVPNLKPGMSASVTIYTDTKADDVPAIPVQAVIGSAQSGFFCFVITPEGPKETPIKLGVSNEKLVEIKEGINEGDVVVLNPKNLSRDSKKDSSNPEPDGPIRATKSPSSTSRLTPFNACTSTDSSA